MGYTGLTRLRGGVQNGAIWRKTSRWRASQAGSTGGPPDPEALAAQAENVYIRRN